MGVTIGTLNADNMSVTLGGGEGSSGHAKTWVKFSQNDNWHEYQITGSMNVNALISVGLMPEGAGEMGPPEWTTPPYAVEIGTDVTSIGEAIFWCCSGLTSVTIPDSVTSIETEAFYSCSGLTSITIPDNVTSIEAEAFYDCIGLSSLIIPASVTSIGEYAFSSCSGLTSVTFQGKTLAQVQELDNYPWGIEDTSIIHVA